MKEFIDQNFKKMKYKHYPQKLSTLLAGSLLALFMFTGCGDDDDDDDQGPMDQEVTAIFSATASGNTVTFVNASVNADTYEWSFGDGGTSTDKDPVHTYAEPGAYNVTLTASNATFEDEVTEEILTENAGPIASVLVGQTWIAVRGESFAYSLGPTNGAGVDWDDLTPLWFSWGDGDGAHQTLQQRSSLANDEYTFHADGTYDVDFKGDFWGEFGIWSGVAGADEENIDIVDNSLPLNTDGENVDAFIAGTWDWVVDEDNMTLEVRGAGAHILNPRLKNDVATFDVGTGITYTVTRVVQGTEADTIVMYVDTNDGANDLREYHTMAAYHGTVPEMDMPPPPQWETSVMSNTVVHDFLSEDGVGSGVGSVDGPYVITYGDEIDGETCTKFERGGGDENFRWANYLMRTDQAEINFSTGTTVKVDVYFPSSNDYDGELTQTIWIRYIDESRLGGNFWQEYLQVESAEIPVDTWTTVTLDFSTVISDGAAAGNSPDGVMIEFGGSNHLVGGTFYAKNWIVE